MNLKLVILFWTDGKENSTRETNVKYSWSELKKLTTYLKSNNVACDNFLFDFSPNKTHHESIHIPFPLGFYLRSKKLNLVIDRFSENDTLFIFDCDTFFTEEDYPKVLDLIKNCNENNLYTFDLAKLDEVVSKNYLDEKIINLKNENWSFAYSGFKSLGPLANGRLGGMGGVFMIKCKILKMLNGFDESYETWGGEDGEITNRFMESRIGIIEPQRHFFPFHLYHLSDYNNPLYYK